MKKLNLSFKKAYLIYVIVLVVAMIAALMYVNSLLHKCEEMRPEKCVEAAIEQLAKDAKDESFFTKYSLAEIEKGEYEKEIDVKKRYLELFASDDLTISVVNGKGEEDTAYYNIKKDGRPIAEVKLKAMGPSETKLIVLNYREWQLEEITPIFEKIDYSITLPQDFSVSANGIALDSKDGKVGTGKKITYTVPAVYLQPTFEIKDQNGTAVNYTVDNKKVLAEFYDYIITLPETIEVKVNGSVLKGTPQDNNLVSYNVRALEKPEVIITDTYGNSFNYDGKTQIPLTHMTILADSGYTVKIEGNDIAKDAVTQSVLKEYEQLKDYVKDLPKVSKFNVAILKKEADVQIIDKDGKTVSYEAGLESYDFTESQGTLDKVPSEVASEIDVLKTAQYWSMFLTKDKKFSDMTPYLIKGSYQYDVAKKFAYGVDITFTSAHTLANPAFTEESVTNFKWISDNCFSVDVHFIKHMILTRNGTRVDDETNDRFYFVKWDDTEDGVNNPTWKIASMREIVENEN